MSQLWLLMTLSVLKTVSGGGGGGRVFVATPYKVVALRHRYVGFIYLLI